MKLNIFRPEDFLGAHFDGTSDMFVPIEIAVKNANLRFNEWLKENSKKVYGFDGPNDGTYFVGRWSEKPGFYGVLPDTHEALIIGIKSSK